MFKIAVCDDNLKFLEMVGKAIESFGGQMGEALVVRTFSDSDELLEMIEENDMFDAYFLDVEMPRHSGLELVDHIRKVTAIPPIVLLTGFDIYAIDACGKNIFKYVLKTTWREKSDELLRELIGELRRLKDNHVYIINNQRRYVKIPHHHILYIAKEQKNAVFFLKDKRCEFERETLKNVFRKLDNPVMYFLDRSLILNMLHVRRIEGRMIEMDDGFQVYAGEETLRQLKKYLTAYWGGSK